MADVQPERVFVAATSLTGMRRLLWVLTLVQVLCGIGLAIDLWSELPDPGYWRFISPEHLLHLSVEVGMVGLVLIGLAVTRYAMTKLHAERNTLRAQLGSLRGEFDTIIRSRFADWRLTPSQSDVALLTLRGLRLSEIAAARTCAEGTVKSHMNAIFRAAGVGTRSEFIGLFMDELLDFGALSDPQAARGADPTR